MPPLLGSYGLTLFLGCRYWPHAAAVTWYAFFTVAWLVLALRRGWRTDAFLLLAVFHLLVLTPEVYLRFAGFRWETGIQFGYPRPHQFLQLAPDEDLFWILPPERPEVNAQGFHTLDLPRARESGLVRITFLGDSVAYQGYPEIVETMLTARARSRIRYEVVNLSLTGYSSHQGRILSRKYGDLVPSDFVVVNYGWNDHWLAWGAVDADKVVASDRSGAGSLTAWLYHRVRLLQALRYVVDSLGRADEEQPLAEVRVSSQRYRENLEYMGELWSSSGAHPVLITAPTSHYRLGMPDYLVENGFVRDKESAAALHRAYNRIVRDVALEHGWSLLDLERELESADLAVLEKIFTEDGIHLTTHGLAFFAGRVVAELLEGRRDA